MTATKTAWTVNSIKQANQAAGFYWFSPDSMRCFRTKVLPTVYQGPGGVFFVTLDGQYDRNLPRRYTVRQFKPATAQIDTVGKVASLTRARAVQIARDESRKGMVGFSRMVPADQGGIPVAFGGIGETTERFKPVIVLEQFVADLRRHGNPNASLDDASRLIYFAGQHHKLAEDACNGPDDTTQQDAVCTAIERLARMVGASGVILGGDPRGCTVKLTFKDGHTNDFGKEGYCVPTSRKDGDE